MAALLFGGGGDNPFTHFYARPTCRAGREEVLPDPHSLSQILLCTPSTYFKVRGNGAAVGKGPGPYRLYTSTGEGLF